MDFYVIKIVTEWRIYRQIILKSRSWRVHGFLCDLEPGESFHLHVDESFFQVSHVSAAAAEYRGGNVSNIVIQRSRIKEVTLK